ncbi:DUF4381 domain-containing protein [Rhodanobacter sp. 7MK24]|nr:DUF4381 domain-containing protein [Rhodanobacter sp. 7MK24]
MMPQSLPQNGPELRDIHLPPAPSWWPLAPGWWAMIVLVLLAVIVAAWFLLHRHRQHKQQRLLLGELEELAARHARVGDDAALAAALHQLLRRVARSHDEAATRQRGDSWRRTLARVPVAIPVLDRLMALEQAIYRPQAKLDAPATLAAARSWLRAAASPRAWKPLAVEQGHV